MAASLTKAYHSKALLQDASAHKPSDSSPAHHSGAMQLESQIHTKTYHDHGCVPPDPPVSEANSGPTNQTAIGFETTYAAAGPSCA